MIEMEAPRSRLVVAGADGGGDGPEAYGALLCWTFGVGYSPWGPDLEAPGGPGGAHAKPLPRLTGSQRRSWSETTLAHAARGTARA